MVVKSSRIHPFMQISLMHKVEVASIDMSSSSNVILHRPYLTKSNCFVMKSWLSRGAGTGVKSTVILCTVYVSHCLLVQ